MHPTLLNRRSLQAPCTFPPCSSRTCTRLPHYASLPRTTTQRTDLKLQQETKDRSQILRISASSRSRSDPPASDVDVDAPTVATVIGKNTASAYKDRLWRWRGHNINYVAEGSGPPLILIHGFGANLRHYRQTIPELAESNTVYAIDLLGFGKSDKPIGFEFSIEAWRDLVLDFIDEVVEQPAVLVGNSIGSLISLTVAARAEEEAMGVVRGVVLLNCAGGMNSKFIMESPMEEDDLKYKLFSPLFWLIDRILTTRFIAEPLFNNIKTPENIRQVLGNVYVNSDANVDDELVDMFVQPSLDPGAFETFVAVLTGQPGPRPERVAPQVKCPMCIIWGREDIVTDLQGPIGQYFQELAEKSGPEIQMNLVNTNHCPQDDDPLTVNNLIRNFEASL